MTRWRLVPLALLVAVLLGVVALAAHGRPLGGGSGSGSGSANGPSSSFLNYVNTSVILVIIASAVLMLWLIVTSQSARGDSFPRRRHPLATIAFLVICALLGWGLASKKFERRFHAFESRLHLTARQKAQEGPKSPQVPKGARPVELRWDEIAIVLALLAALGIGGYVANRRRSRPVSWQLASQAAVSTALDESLDDLRSEPDLRKAIIAAYARMERALAIAGLPRRPAEAPLEYVERALGELETSAGAIRKLTDLFEWAKFSHHEPDPAMRDEAIDALAAVRDELRTPAAEPVAA